MIEKMTANLRNLLCNVSRQSLLLTRGQSGIVGALPTSTCFVGCIPINKKLQPEISGCRYFKKFTPEDLLKKRNIPDKWLKYNDIVYPPQKPGDPRRPAEICHQLIGIKYSPEKLWYMAMMIRGMTVDEAIKQLSKAKHKGAHFILRAIKEAQEMAVAEYNVEFKSNLWIESSLSEKCFQIHNQRKHARHKPGRVNHYYSNYFVRLREGKPPEHYYPPPETGYEKLERYIKEQRKRTIKLSL